MVAYKFRVKINWNPTKCWRDIVIGEKRTLNEFQDKINEAFGLDKDHLWFFGEDNKYWNSNIQYISPNQKVMDISPFMESKKEIKDASKIKLKELRLETGDRISYLFDYGDEWRFYAIFKEIKEDKPGNVEPKVVKSKGKDLIQYPEMGEKPEPGEGYRYHPWYMS